VLEFTSLKKTFVLGRNYQDMGLSFEERKTYGMDIPRRIHVRKDMKQ
jgi:hypothetical protein